MKDEARKLNGSVRKIEAEIAMFEMVDGNLAKTESRPGGYCLYDEAGKLIEEVSSYRILVDGIYKDIYFYDEAGELLYRDEYHADESLVGKTIFEQSENGGRIEKHYYFDKQGTLKLGSHTVYDGAGEFVETAHYDENEAVNPRHVYTDDPARRVRKRKALDGNGHELEELLYQENGEFRDKQVTVYDAFGNVREFSCFAEDGTLSLKDEYEYEFDSEGNWVRQIQHHWVIGWGEFKLVPLAEVNRKIEYY